MAGVRGQGRQFDIDDALDKAMDIFWRNGYEGTSIAKLTTGMGITASSLYAAFQDKQHLFDQVVEHYLNTEGRFTDLAFNEEEHALPLIRRILFEAADKYSDKSGPGGCLIACAATCVTDANRDIEKKLESHRISNIKRIKNIIDADLEKEVIVSDVNAENIAEFIGTVLQGMAQRGRDGASLRNLQSTARITYICVECTFNGFDYWNLNDSSQSRVRSEHVGLEEAAGDV